MGATVVACAPVPEGSPGHDLELSPAELTTAIPSDPCDGYAVGTLSGDDLLVRINKEPDHQLRRDWFPLDLEPLAEEHQVPGKYGAMRHEAHTALLEMLAAARTEAGLGIRVYSSYRSFDEQCSTFSYKVETKGLEHAQMYSALPGRSQHQLGTTVDLTAASVEDQLWTALESQPEGVWLAANAGRFGFVMSYPKGLEEVTGYAFEPWHFRYIGRAAAAEMHAAGLDLEAYLSICEYLAWLRTEPTQEPSGPALVCPREGSSAP